MFMIEKILSLGANCISSDFAAVLNIREKSPVDWIDFYNFKNSKLLFKSNFVENFLNSKYEKKLSTPEEFFEFNFWKYNFILENQIKIVHFNFESENYKGQLKSLFENFNKYIEDAKNNDNFWFAYSLSAADEKITQKELNQLIKDYPSWILKKTLFISSWGTNKAFENTFPYYAKIKSNYSFCKNDAFEIKKIFESKYGLTFASPK